MENFSKAELDAKVREGLPFKHHWHNRFHLEMPFGLINDPNGLAFLKGEYHIFFQWNPLGVKHENKCWAHTKTRDFVHYSAPELALWPTDEHDKDGCYSGSGFVDGADLKVLYTCNAKDAVGKRTPAQRVGTLKDGAIEKGEIVVPKNVEGYTPHFRDPYVFKSGGKRYFVLGAQRANETGTVVIFREGKNGWEYKGELRTALTNFGYMWECPNLLKIGDADVLIFCPQGLTGHGYEYQNLYQSGYVSGRLKLDSLTLEHGPFEELDYGFDFYAPQALTNEGRTVLMGWMGMPEKEAEYPTGAYGWMHSLTMPRELTLWNGHIYSRPAAEMKALRQGEAATPVKGENTAELTTQLFEGSDIRLELELGAAREIAIELLYGEEKLALRYSRDSHVMTIDRTGMKLGGGGVRRLVLRAEKLLTLRLYVDKSAIETFFQHGEKAASLCVFPEQDVAPVMRITGDAPLKSVNGRVWEMGAYSFN